MRDWSNSAPANPRTSGIVSGLTHFASTKLGGFLVCLVMVSAAYAGLNEVSVFRNLEGRLLDLRFQVRGELAPGREVVIVEIDDPSVLALGGWPLPRESLAGLVATLSADRARAIAIDLLLVGSAGAGSRLAGFGDRELAAALSRAGNVILPFAFTFDAKEANFRQVPAEIGEVALSLGDHDAPWFGEFGAGPSGLLAPAKRFLRPSFPAQVNIFADGTGALREANLAIRYGERYFPSLPVEVLRLYLGQPRDRVVLSPGKSLKIGDLTIPTDSKLRLPVNFYGPEGTFERYSLTDVLEGRVAPGTFSNRIVLVGSTALGVGDAFVTPFSDSLPGVEHFATVIDNILHGRILHRNLTTFGIDLLVILACILGCFILLHLKRVNPSVILAGTLVATCLIGNLGAFILADLWLNLTFPLMVLAFGIPLMILRSVPARQTEDGFAAAPNAAYLAQSEPMQDSERRGGRPPLTELRATAQQTRHLSAHPEAARSAAVPDAHWPRVVPLTESQMLSEPASPSEPSGSGYPARALSASAADRSRPAAEVPRGRPVERPEMARPGANRALPATNRPQLDDQPGQQRRGPQAALMAIELRGFAELAESLSPDETMNLMRRFGQTVEKSVLEHGGMIEAFSGDTAMGVFGLPENDPRASLNALRAARQLLGDFEQINQQLDRYGLSRISITAGLHFGPVTLGTGAAAKGKALGGRGREAFTVTGESVNVATRLERLTQREGAGVIVSEVLFASARALGGDAAVRGFREMPLQASRGGRRPIVVWALYPNSRGRATGIG